MSDAPLTLKDFFCDGDTPPLASGDLLANVKRGKGGLPTAALPAMSGAVEQALAQVFGVPIGNVLEASWSKVAGLPDALAASKLNPGAVTLTPLIDHTVTSTHSPKIDLFIGGQRLGEVALGIQLSLKLKGVTLELKDGRISGLRSGECSGEGVVSFGGQPLLKRKTPGLPLPGRLSFGA